MEVDINYEWTTFNFDGTFGARDPTKLVPGMARLATRYLSPDDRDFFAVYALSAATRRLGSALVAAWRVGSDPVDREPGHEPHGARCF